jgi:homoserine kinase
MPIQSVTFQIPGTTANLGPGYDCLGVALGLSNRVTVSRTATPSVATAPTAAGPMAATAAALFFKSAQAEPFAFDWKIEGEVPQSRGMGSSVTVRLGLLSGLNVLADSPLSRKQLFEICAALEGHPDNAAPAAFGGFTVAGGRELARFEVNPALAFVLLIPNFEISTPEARKVLPKTLDRLSAVASCANACRITAAFASQNYQLLKGAFSDGLHQPFRESLIPFLPDVIRAGENAGALGGFLSGSGSTICCVTLDNPEGVARAMQEAAPSEAYTAITTADNEGTVQLP